MTFKQFYHDSYDLLMIVFRFMAWMALIYALLVSLGVMIHIFYKVLMLGWRCIP